MKAKSIKTDCLKSIKNANKESKSITGVCKLVQKFWADGYGEAFKAIGYKCSEVTPELLKDIHQTFIVEGKVCKYAKVFLKDENGEILKDNKGFKVYEKVLKPVELWTPVLLWSLLYESKKITGDVI